MLVLQFPGNRQFHDFRSQIQSRYVDIVVRRRSVSPSGVTVCEVLFEDGYVGFNAELHGTAVGFGGTRLEAV